MTRTRPACREVSAQSSCRLPSTRSVTTGGGAAPRRATRRLLARTSAALVSAAQLASATTAAPRAGGGGPWHARYRSQTGGRLRGRFRCVLSGHGHLTVKRSSLRGADSELTRGAGPQMNGDSAVISGEPVPTARRDLGRILAGGVVDRRQCRDLPATLCWGRVARTTAPPASADRSPGSPDGVEPEPEPAPRHAPARTVT